MKKLFFLLTIVAMMLSSWAFAQKTWTGASSTAWNLAGNWSPSGIPTASDNVIIPSAPANQPLISGTITPVCNNLTVNSGATLTITGTSGSNATLTVAGTTTFNGTLSIGGHWQGNLGKLVTSSVVWNSTSAINAYVNGRMEVSGNWTFSSGSSVDMSWCWVTLTGTGNSTITNNSASSKFSSLTLGKSATATTTISAASTATLTITGGLVINASNTLNCAANITTVVQGNIISNGYFKLYSGTVSLEGVSGTQSIQMANTGNIFNSLKINCGGTVTLNNSLAIQGNLTIQAGTFNPQNNTLYVTGNWINTAGPAYFTEGTGKVVFNVIINKDGGRDFDNIIQNSENFNILELNNAYGDLIINSGLVVVTCNQYDWVAGGLNVSQGVFTALDLADNGIFGRYTLSGTGTINLTNDDGYVDLNGSTINISGGNFNVYGGTTDSYWPFTQNASLTMSGGVLNFAETGIRVSASTTTLTSNITGGTIKTAKDFLNYRSDFNPAGGTIEMYGPTDAVLFCVSTAALYGVKINKTASKDGENTNIIYPRIDRETGEVITDETRAQTVNLNSTIIFNGNFVLTSGAFNSNSHTIQAKRDWTNNAGPGSFNPGTGRVIFNGGNYHQYCYNETFNILEVAKASGGAFRLSSGTSVTCAVYDWTAGSIDVLANGGTFTALDLSDNGIFGGYYVNPGGTINLYQDIYQYIDLNGSLTFTNGGTINIYGGNGASQWASGANAFISMNAGTLDFKDQGITLTVISPYNISANITGGTIRTTGSFFCNRTDFNPTGGTIELYGTQNASLSMTTGSLYNLSINKSVANNVSLSTNTTLTGGLTVNGGTLNMNGKTLVTGRESAVNNGGILNLNAGSALMISGTWWININDGGLIRVIGSAGNPAMISRNGASGYIFLNVMDGGTISARNAWFHYFSPLRVTSGGLIDPNNPFDDCQFRYTTTGILWVETEQTLLIRNAEFLTPATGYNVRKSSNNGELTFKDATGNYAGAAYENDPYNRIHWTVTQPGLWTGAESSSWYNAGNWDDGVVPNAGTNVVIPATAPNMPEIDAGEWYINSLTANGSLNFDGGNLTVYGNAAFNGEMLVTSPGSQFVVLGDVYWNSGSSAGINQDVTLVCNGNWNFNAGSSVQFSNGSIIFAGNTSKWIRSFSENCFFHHLYIQKTGGAQIGFSDLSTKKLEISGDFKIWPLANFAADAGQDMILHGDFISNGSFEGNAGRLVFDGVNQIITPNTADYFNNLKFNQSGTVSVNTVHTSTIIINDNLQIYSGVFAPGNVTINLAGDWSNPVGPDAFNESNTTVVFNGAGNVQRIYNHENYMTLVLEKSGSGSVLELSSLSNINCQYYNWNDGGLSVVNGSFTAHSLVGGIIGGDVSVSTNGTITMGNLSEQMDLIGRLFIDGGKFNIINGMSSQWPGNGNAQITMSGGEINVYPYGIEIVNNPPYVFVNQITGGKIRTTGSFVNHRNDFNPTAGTIELYGTGDAYLSMNTPSMASLHNVTIDKQASESKGGSVTLYGSLLVGNELKVNEGTFTCSTGNMLVVVNQVDVYGGGVLSFEPGSAFGLYAGCQLIIDQGGTFQSHGTESQPIFVDRFGSSGFYDFGVGGTISSRYTSFNNCGNLIVGPTGFIDPDNAFYHCSFPYAVGALLVINNSQNVTLRGVQFPNVPISMNVKKTIDQGRVIMKDATGPGAGPAYEYDPYNRIDWEVSQPGLWTGNISTDWHTDGNWDDLNIPSSASFVVIPESVASGWMPVINQNAVCQGIQVFGTLLIDNEELTVNQNMTVMGGVTINDVLNVKGNLTWWAGSIADVAPGSLIKCSGNFTLANGSDVQLNNGVIQFEGSGNSSLICHAANAYMNQVQVNKEGGAWLLFDGSSTKPLTINENLSVAETAGFKSQSNQPINLNKHLIILGAWQCDAGAVILGGASPIVTMSPGNYFHDLKINTSYGGVTFTEVFSNEVKIKNDLLILSGNLNGSDQIFRIGRDWQNQTGTSAFIPQNSTVIFDGNIPAQGQFIYGSTHFNIFELQQHADNYLRINDGSLVVVNKFDWTSGTIEVESGHFIAYDLLDNRLTGNWKLYQSGQISLSDENAIGLGGNLTIYGGTFSLSGGSSYYSYWPFGDNASLTMSGGVLELNNQSVFIRQDQNFTFTSNITGGTIRTYGWFLAENPGFNPAGGMVELYGETAGYITSANGGNFHNLRVNKSSISPDIGLQNVVVKNTMTIDGGRCNIMNGHSLNCQGALSLNSGWLEIYPGGLLKMGNQSLVNVWSGAELRSYGTPEQMCTVTGLSPSSYYGIFVAAGGYISMINTIFEQLDETGLFVVSEALVDEANAFNGCVFRNGKPLAYPLLTINNLQQLQLENVEFSGLGRGKNAAKYTDQGSLLFIDATGNLSGGAFESDPFFRIFWQGQSEVHSISLPAGWSGISSYLIPSQPWMQDVFAPISNELIIAQTMTGMYYPEQFINTIGTWTSHSAYKIKTTEACVLPITGSFETDMTVSLNAGWSLLPQVTPFGANVNDLFAPVNGFVIAKDVAGTAVYWPQYGINTIGTLMPGKAYYVLMNSPGVVDYTGMKSATSGTLTGFETLSGLGIAPTPSTHTIAILPEALKCFDQGTIIGAYDQSGNCFGATIISENANHLAAFGDDPTTAEKDGFFEGEMIIFQTLTGFGTLSGLLPTFDHNLPQSSGFFAENGLSAITGFESSTGVGFTDFGRLVNIFPNPSDGVVNIAGLQPDAKITVTDVQGQVVLVAEALTAGQASIDLTDSTAGVYFIKIEINGQHIFRKIVLR